MNVARMLGMAAIVTAFLFAASMVSTADEQGGAAADDLAAQITRLQERVEELEKQVAELQQRGQIVPLQGLYEAQPATTNAEESLPRGAVKGGEINGMPFYIVPLSAGGNRTVARPASSSALPTQVLPAAPQPR